MMDTIPALYPPRRRRSRSAAPPSVAQTSSTPSAATQPWAAPSRRPCGEALNSAVKKLCRGFCGWRGAVRSQQIVGLSAIARCPFHEVLLPCSPIERRRAEDTSGPGKGATAAADAADLCNTASDAALQPQVHCHVCLHAVARSALGSVSTKRCPSMLPAEWCVAVCSRRRPAAARQGRCSTHAFVKTSRRRTSSGTCCGSRAPPGSPHLLPRCRPSRRQTAGRLPGRMHSSESSCGTS